MGRGAGLSFPNYYAVAKEDDCLFSPLLMSSTRLYDPQLPIYSSQVFYAMPDHSTMEIL